LVASSGSRFSLQRRELSVTMSYAQKILPTRLTELGCALYTCEKETG
jgi:hypothetical protein